MNIIRGTYRFLYDFIIGDDWKVAAAVVAALAVGFILLLAGLPPSAVTVTTAVLVAVAFSVALLIDVRTRPRGDPGRVGPAPAAA